MEERRLQRANNKALKPQVNGRGRGDEESERIISIVRLVSDDFTVTKAAANRFQPDNKVRLSSSPLHPPSSLSVTKTLYPSSAGITRLRFCITDFKETTYTVKCTNITSRGVESVQTRFPLSLPLPPPWYRLGWLFLFACSWGTLDRN